MARSRDERYALALDELDQLRAQGKIGQNRYDIHRSKLLAESQKGTATFGMRLFWAAVTLVVVLVGIIAVRFLIVASR